MSRGTSLSRLRKILTERGYTHPRAEGTPWQITGIFDSVLGAARGVAGATMPKDLKGTRFGAEGLAGLDSRLERVLKGVERLEASDLNAVERRALYDDAALLLEPFLTKVLAVLEPDKLTALAKKRKKLVGLSALIELLAECGRSPIDRSVIDLPAEEFESPKGWDQRSTLDNALRDVLRVRIDVAHKAPAPLADELARLPWCVLVLVLGVTEKNIDDLARVDAEAPVEEEPQPRPSKAGKARLPQVEPRPAAKAARPAPTRSPAVGLSSGARLLPPTHVSIRVPWHDDGWAGTICKAPRENTSCLVLPRIATGRNDDREEGCSGRRWDTLASEEMPACVAERASFMAPFELTRSVSHAYAATSKKHSHFQPTPFPCPTYSAACVPFRWMLKRNVDGYRTKQGTVIGIQEQYELGYDVRQEPDLGFKTSWVQEKENQLALLDTFFGAVRKDESLCFFYAKRTPLSEDNRRVLIGVGRVAGVGPAVEYRYDTDSPPLRCVAWERNIAHSIRPSFEDGFLIPYQQIVALAEEDASIRLEDFVAFAPDDRRAEFSYTAEHVSHDGAIASLLVCAAALETIATKVDFPLRAALDWIDQQLNRLWKMRGPCPGLGSALIAFGIQRGNLVAYAIAAHQARSESENEDPWPVFEQLLDDPSATGADLKDHLGAGYRDVWKKLPGERRALLQLLSRFELTASQAMRFFQPTERTKARYTATDRELLENPYLIFELDRTVADPVSIATVDRGLFPDAIVRELHPVPAPSVLDGEVDWRRVRAFVVDTLELAKAEGHTLLPRDWVIERVRARSIRPACPLSQDVTGACEDRFAPALTRIELSDGSPGYQLTELATVGATIRDAVEKRLRGKRHSGQQPWRRLVDAEFDPDTKGKGDADEDRARTEKAAALEEVFSSRVSVLVGPAGTGKTKLLKILCSVPQVEGGGVLFLAPTGKARVRIESQTQRKGALTIAQFLVRLGRYDGTTGRYRLAPPDAKKEEGFKTVIIDECSMLTEEQLAAVFDAVKGVERFILVGDPRQLPPIGSGRPFVDVIRKLAPVDIEGRLPAVAPGYAELRVSRRQTGAGRDDLLLAHWFSGRPTDPGADEIWNRLESGGVVSSHLELVRWDTPDELDARILEKLENELRKEGQSDEEWFELAIGGNLHEGYMYFFAGRDGKRGAASKVDDWQVLSPTRAQRHGVDAINRRIQERYRKRIIEWSEPKNYWMRKIPKRMGPQGIVWGDKVINVQNSYREPDDVYPKPSDDLFIANGELGVVVGEYKYKGDTFMPKNLQVEFWSTPSYVVKFKSFEFRDEASSPLELAYALTVHKTQGSEFGITFVVLPNPCRLLSRELLYTALTRQKNKVVVLHQGDVRALKRFASEHDSDIARRLTNLFCAAAPVKFEDRFFERGLIHRTARGRELVRSKSEVIVADLLDGLGIDYSYEQQLNGKYPDFTVDDAESGEKVYWEHLGLLHDASYRLRWESKLSWYRAQGILPFGEGGGPNGTLVWSEDQPNGAIDAEAMKNLMRRVFKLR